MKKQPRCAKSQMPFHELAWVGFITTIVSGGIRQLCMSKQLQVIRWRWFCLSKPSLLQRGVYCAAGNGGCVVSVYVWCVRARKERVLPQYCVCAPVCAFLVSLHICNLQKGLLGCGRHSQCYSDYCNVPLFGALALCCGCALISLLWGFGITGHAARSTNALSVIPATCLAGSPKGGLGCAQAERLCILAAAAVQRRR